MATNDNRYPRFQQRWQDRLSQIDDHIEGWWNRTKADFREADTPREAAAGAWNETQRAGDRIADSATGRNDLESKLERAGDSVGNWWANLKNNVADWFDGDDIDDDARAEYRQAVNDDEFIGQRFEERAEYLRGQGRIK
jgi:hypothetical protein